MSDLAQKQTCDECGTELPANAPEGLCPRCLVGMVLKLENASTESTRTAPEIRVAKSSAAPIRRFGDYELVEEIARGGMGIVYKARQTSLNRIVAVKVLLFGEFSSPEFVQRFRTEAKAAASLQHPNIVAIHEIGEEAGQHYFSMDYVEGNNLAELVRAGPLTPRRAAKYLKRIAEAVEFAHSRGTLHRDLKPSNVLVDEFDEPRITDFGLAKHMDDSSRLTVTGQVLGSPGYMPPEQAGSRHRGVGPFSDVYALGAVLYHLITGRAPFVAETLNDTLVQVINSEPVPPRLLNPSVPRDLETICLKCLEKEPGRRYLSARAFGDDLDRFLLGQPIIARPVSTLEKLWRWCRRKPELAGAVGLLIFLAAASMVTAIRFDRLRTEADGHREEARLARYVSDMNVALEDLTPPGNGAQALALLEANLPKAGETDLRGFEWYYLWRRSHPPPLHSFPKHNQVLGEMRFSADGKLLASCCWDNTVRVWNLETGSRLVEMSGAPALGAFSADGNRFLAGASDGSLYSYNLGSGARSLVRKNDGELVATTPDGTTFVTRKPDGTLQVSTLGAEGFHFSLPQRVNRYLDFGLRSPVAISPDGRMLALIQPIQDQQRRVNPAITLFDVASRAQLDSLPENRQIHSMQFSPDGRLLAVGDGVGKVRLWDIQARQSKLLEAYDLPVSALAFSADGRALATGSSAPGIKLWDVATGTQQTNIIGGHVGQVWSLAFSPDGQLLASGGRNSPIKVWSLFGKEAQDETQELASEHWANFTFSPNGKLMAAGCKGETVKVWNVQDFSLKAPLRGASYAVAFSFDSRELLTASLNELPRWWDLETIASRPAPAYHAGSMTNRVICVDFSPDRTMAALGCKDGFIEIVEIASAKQTARWKAHNDEVRSVAFSPNGSLLVSGAGDHSVAEWIVSTQRRLGSNIEHKGAICAVTFSQDGKLIATGCGAGTIKLWDPNSPLTSSLSSIAYHQAGIRSLAFSPDGLTLASGSDDHTVKLWNLKLRQQVASFPLDRPVQLVAFSPDGQNLATVTEGGKLKLYRAANKREADEQEK